MLKGLKQFNLPELEEKVLKFWKEHNVFEQSLKNRKALVDKAAGEKSKNKVFRFFEGPPGANGRPHIGHAETRVFKDIILRYKTMRGYYVPRRAGWDTHGLPVEIEVEKALGINNKQDIEKFGIAEFNARAKESVWVYKSEWERFSERIGFWIDTKNPYITYANDYIESLWWVFSQVAKRKLLKKAHRIVPWCPRCQTPLSSHELAQAYKLTKDPAVYVKFRISDKRQATGDMHEFLLIWTTTPWTLPGNVAVAVNPELKYTKYKIGDEYVWSYSLPPEISGVKPEPVENKMGKELVGVEYEPLYNSDKKKSSLSTQPSHKASAGQAGSGTKFYKVLPAEFVSTEQGTGLVHIAPAFGEDDASLIAKEWKLTPEEVPFTIDEAGKMLKGFPGAGKVIKQADEDILTDLKSRGLLYARSTIEHDYPFCWRCDTALIYFARSSWFIEMSKLREDLLSANAKINWVPAHIKDGRFGEWLREVKDWAISRERYWGTPLPIWECESCLHTRTIGSLEDLDKRRYKPNRFFVLRHGEAQHNILGLIASGKEIKGHKSKLTKKGAAEALFAAKVLKKEGIDIMVSSPYFRTLETAKIVGKVLKIKNIIKDERLKEFDCGVFNWKPIEEHKAVFKGNPLLELTYKPVGGESLVEVRARMMRALLDIDKKYEGKNILIVSHGDPLWMLESAIKGIKGEDILRMDYIQPAESRELLLHNWPYNLEGDLDIHRPFVDEIYLTCDECQGKMKRVKEVADVWFDSGAMPYAQWHYPFQNKEMVDGGIQFPADYITEGVDQTRGWFYTLLAVSTLLRRGVPYHNVVSLGHVLDKNGQKMSKSKGNVVEPGAMMNKYGADVLRWYFYSLNSPGEAKRFDEADLLKVSRRFFAIIYNSFVFLETYGVKTDNGRWVMGDGKARSANILDRWINAKVQALAEEVTHKLDNYQMFEASRALEAFVDDLSRWYIRRSRRRFQRPESREDLEAASSTLREMLLTLAKLFAPFAPFFSEMIYKSLQQKEEGSVHLEDWPEVQKNLQNKELMEAMDEVRRLANLALAERAKAGVKVRQPLQALRVKSKASEIMKELSGILKDEVNVKEIVFDPKIKSEIELDIVITPELKEEGLVREFVRMVQDLRQDAGYKPGESAMLFVEAPSGVAEALERNSLVVKKDASLSKVEFKRSQKFDAEISTEIDGGNIWIGIKKE